jgi:hypothetical protein
MRRHAYLRHPVAWGVALSIAAHAAIALVAWRAAGPTEAPPTVSLTVRLLERSSPHASAAAVSADTADSYVVRSEPPRRRAAARPRAIAAARSGSVAATERPPPPPEVISGAVFALPHIGFGGSAVATSWMRTVRPPTPSVQAAQPDLSVQAVQAQREASRALLVAALEQQVGALPAPVESVEGMCTLGAQTERQLDCDNSALHTAVTPQAPALSGLLLAYRSIEPRTAGLSIGFSNGRYQVSLAMGTKER